MCFTIFRTSPAPFNKITTKTDIRSLWSFLVYVWITTFTLNKMSTIFAGNYVFTVFALSCCCVGFTHKCSVNIFPPSAPAEKVTTTLGQRDVFNCMPQFVWGRKIDNYKENVKGLLRAERAQAALILSVVEPYQNPSTDRACCPD